MITINRTTSIILFVIGLTIAGQFSGVIYLPSLPIMTIYFDSSASMIKLVLILYLLGFGCSQLFFGPYSDQKGRKKALLLGLSLAFIGNLFCTFTSNLLIFIFSRILVGAGSGATASVGRAILRDTFEDKDQLIKATSLIGMVTALTPAIGPAMGGVIQQIGEWQYNFLLLTIYTFIMLFICLFSFRESNHHQNKAIGLINTMKGFHIVIKSSSFCISVLCASIAFSGLIAYEMSAPFLFENIYGLTSSQFGFISFFIAISLSLGAFINGKFLKHTSKKRVKFASFLFIISATTLFVITFITSTNPIFFLISSMFFASGVGIIFSTVIAEALIPFTTYAGSASALFGFSQMMLTMFINLIFSLVDVTSPGPIGLIFLGCGISILILSRIKSTVVI